MHKIVAAVVVNDKNDILGYTVQATKEEVEVLAIEIWGVDTWEKLQAKGSRIANCEISLIE